MENNQQSNQLSSDLPVTSHTPSKTFIQHRFGAGFIILIVLILIAVVGAGGYFLGANQNQVGQNQPQPVTPITPSSPTPTPDEIAKWKTYINTKYGLELKYPSNFEIAESSVDNVFYIQTVGWTTDKTTLVDSYQIQITYLKDKIYSAEEYMELDSDKIPPLPHPDFTKTTINRISTIIKSYKDESYFAWGGNKQYYLYKDSKGVILDGSGKNHKIFDQILSTFQFTDQP
ncbi:hypothetical protein HYT32_00675 [Candidatus Roizmanbacteria bacterium]|nr:hypothetical protein [Candidatus Roizmanbacteria bacterium]